MARKAKDIAGQIFGEWTVLRRAGRDPKSRQITWRCRCSCGTEKEIRGGTLRQGLSQSCGGCLDRSALHTTHGLSRTPAYHVWRQMLDRCENEKNAAFAHYGGRGISVCERWHSVEVFAEDMGQPSSGDTLDRADVNGNYCPENCRWVSQKVQTRNARSNIEITFNDRTQCIGAWAEELNIKYGTLYSRIVTYGWSVERALTTSVGKTRPPKKPSTQSCDELPTSHPERAEGARRHRTPQEGQGPPEGGQGPQDTRPCAKSHQLRQGRSPERALPPIQGTGMNRDDDAACRDEEGTNHEEYEVSLFRPSQSNCSQCGGTVRILRPKDWQGDETRPAFFLCDCGYVGQLGVNALTEVARWDSDVVQFARLVAEMSAEGLLNRLVDYEALMARMDLSREDLNSLFERAIKRWDTAKERVR